MGNVYIVYRSIFTHEQMEQSNRYTYIYLYKQQQQPTSKYIEIYKHPQHHVGKTCNTYN